MILSKTKVWMTKFSPMIRTGLYVASATPAQRWERFTDTVSHSFGCKLWWANAKPWSMNNHSCHWRRAWPCPDNWWTHPPHHSGTPHQCNLQPGPVRHVCSSSRSQEEKNIRRPTCQHCEYHTVHWYTTYTVHGERRHMRPCRRCCSPWIGSGTLQRHHPNTSIVYQNI